MNLIPNRLLLAGILALSGSATAAATLVVRSVGPSSKLYPTGKVIAANGRIALQPNDEITLLDAAGTHVLRGPGVFSGAAATTTVESTTRFAALLGQGQEHRVRIGAVRGVSMSTPHRPNIWFVDVTQAGAVCITPDTKVTLWRPHASSEQTLTISQGRGPGSSVAWPSGSSTLAWPTMLPTTSKASYSLAFAGGSTPVVIHFVSLPLALTDPQTVASALMEAGCQPQVDALIAQAPIAATPDASN